MLAENMNTTTSFVIVVLVATHGIIGNETTLDTVEIQTDDVLISTTEGLTRNGGVPKTSTDLEDTINTTEEARTTNNSTSAELRTTKWNSYEETTEESSATTEQDHIATNTESTDNLITSVTHKTTTDYEPSTIDVKEQVSRQNLKDNETKINEQTRNNDKNITTTIEIDESKKISDEYKVDNTSKETSYRTLKKAKQQIVHDENNDNSSEHDASMDINNLFKPNDGEIDLTTNFRRMLNFHPELLETTTERNNIETATVARTHSLSRPDYLNSHQENSLNAYVRGQYYPASVTPSNFLGTSSPPLPLYNNQQSHNYQPSRAQPNSLEHGPFSRMMPQDQFNNRQHTTTTVSPMQTFRPQFPFWQVMQPMGTLPPLPSLQPHPQFPPSPIPNQRPSTFQPTQNHKDNIMTSLQQASLHPFLSTKQYNDFYRKDWNSFKK